MEDFKNFNVADITDSDGKITVRPNGREIGRSHADGRLIWDFDQKDADEAKPNKTKG